MLFRSRNVTTEPLFVEHNQDEIYSFCKKSLETIPIKLKNNADIPNNYDISILNAPSWIKLSTNNIYLNKTQDKIAKIYVNTSDIEGDFIFTVDILSKFGDISKLKNISINVENCYEPLIESDKNIVLTYNLTKIPLSITNKGTKTTTYLSSLIGAEWLTIEPSSLTLEPGKQGKLFIVSNPNDITPTGHYKTNVQLKINGTNIIYEGSLKASLVNMNLLDQIYYYFILPYLLYLILALALLIILVILEKPKQESNIIGKVI